jgi:hypothetical protein
MRVRVIKPFRAYWNYSVTEFGEGAELEGDQARHFTDNAPEGSIEVLEADPEPEQEPQKPESEQGDGDPQEPGSDEPPVDGTIDDLMAWVDGDPERAAAALTAEQAKDKPRSTVAKRLNAMADTGDGGSQE